MEKTLSTDKHFKKCDKCYNVDIHKMLREQKREVNLHCSGTQLILESVFPRHLMPVKIVYSGLLLVRPQFTCGFISYVNSGNC